MHEELRALRDISTELLAARTDQQKVDSKCVRELSEKGLLRLLRLRAANKAQALKTEELKEETSKAKCSLEQADLALQNLLYEKSYYEKEIQGCRNFQSAYPDSLVEWHGPRSQGWPSGVPARDIPSHAEGSALQPVEEFWQQCDADLREKAQGSNHELMLQRLTHEMRLRRKMCKELEDLKTSKSSLLQKVSEEEKILKQLQGNLKAMDEAARPLQSVLSGYPAIRNISRTLADLLPVPLYVLYSQLAAAKDALGLPVVVSIVGQQEEAIAFSEHIASESLETADETKFAKKRRLDTTDEVYKAHPLTVEVEVFQERAGNKPPIQLTLRFRYLLNLQLVTACCADPSDDPLLGALFPQDDGNSVPTEALLQLENGTFELDPSQTAKPFIWCQHLAGIDLIPTLPTLLSQLLPPDQSQLQEGLITFRRQQRVVTVVQRLLAVKEASITLKALLANLPKNPLPSITTQYARLPQATLASWTQLKGVSSARRAGLSLEEHHQARLLGIAALGGGAAGTSGTATPVDPMGQAARSSADGEGTGTKQAADVDCSGQEQAAGGLDEGEIPGSPPMTPPPPPDQDHETIDFSHPSLISPRSPLNPSYASNGDDGAAQQLQRMAEPPYCLYGCVLRLPPLEVEVHVRLYLEYPLRPPLMLVQAIREMPKDKKSKARAVDAVNEILIMEQEANLTAVKSTPLDTPHELLLHQLLHLRLCVDDLVAQYNVESGAASARDLELAQLLQARQRRRGRDRRPPVASLVPGGSRAQIG